MCSLIALTLAGITPSQRPAKSTEPTPAAAPKPRRPCYVEKKRIVLNTIIDHPKSEREDIVRITGIHTTTVQRILTELFTERVVSRRRKSKCKAYLYWVGGAHE